MPRRPVLAALLVTLAAASVLLGYGRSDAEDRTTRSVDKHDLSMSATVDEEVARKWQEKELTPSPLSDDSEFLRRVSLDLTGVVPSPNEVVAFLQDESPDKRRTKIDELLERDAYADHFSVVWMQILVGNELLARVQQVAAVRPWLIDAFKKNLPYDKFVKEVVAAEGVTDEDGSTNFMLRFDQETAAIDAAAVVSRIFLGVQIQCAQCHNHPYEKWSKDQFHNLAAFFSRLRRTRVFGEDGKRVAFAIKEDLRGRYIMPDSNPPRQMEPIFLTGEKGDASPGANLRMQYARWMISQENPWFAPMIVNRYWALFMGRGLVEPIDDFGDSNPATHPELLQKLAADFVAMGYDLQYLCRVLTNSKTYQLASKTTGNNADDRKYYSHARLRALSPEQLLNSLMLATGLAQQSVGLDGEKAAQLRMQILQRFIFVFGNDEGAEEVNFEGTIPQVLMMLNGKLTNDAVRAASKTGLAELLEDVEQPALRVERLFLAALGRYPTSEETKGFVGWLRKNADARPPEGNDAALQIGRLDRGQPGQGGGGGGGGKRQGRGKGGGTVPGSVPYEDLLWALLNSSEFRFNH